jgi:FdhD protein
MAKPSVTSVSIKKFVNDQWSVTDDLLAAEEPLEIRLGFGSLDLREELKVSVTMRTPGNDFDLAVGFLFTEGIIVSANDILSVKYCTDGNRTENLENIVRVELHPSVEVDTTILQRNFYTTSSCGICGKASIDAIHTVCKIKPNSTDFRVKREVILQLNDSLRKKQQVFVYTGGIHAAALFDMYGNLIALREDVGRHNALDKLIGHLLMTSSPSIVPDNSVLLLSGRASFELLQKAAMAGIMVVCAVGAPSGLAVETAKSFDITLVGFLRENRLNIYSNASRITE